MRPISLRLKGFTSFKNETTVPFANLDRFVICGPTGAGKSSLLDALTFALFADAPRVGGGSITELISCRSKSFSVVFDFQIRDQIYRVTRRRGGVGGDQLDRETGKDQFELLTKGATDVTTAVQKLLGLKYEHFTQSAFLPQGKFAEFLKAKPADRRELLNDLLHLLIFERMQERANRERETFARQKEQSEKRLREDFAEISEEARTELKRQLTEQQELLIAAAELLPGLQEQRDNLRRARDLTLKLEQKTKELEGRRKQEPAMNSRRAELDAASRAMQIIPLLEQVDACNMELAARRRDLEITTQARSQREAEHNDALKNLKNVSERAAGLPALKEKAKCLTEMIGKVALRDQLAKSVDSQRKKQKALNGERARLLDACKKLTTEVSSLSEELQKAKTRLAAIAYDPKRHRHLEAVRETAIQLQGERSQLAQALRRAEQDDKEAQDAEAAAAKAQGPSIQAEQEKQDALNRKEEAEQTLSAAKDADRAAHLRAGLQLKQPCPVCRRKILELPPSEPVPELEECGHAVETAKREYARVEKAAAQKALAFSAVQAKATAATQKASESRADATRRQGAFSKREKSLEKNVSDLLNGVIGDYVEDRILNALCALKELGEKQRHESDSANTLDRDLQLKQEANRSKDAELSQVARQLEELAESTSRDEESLGKVREEIRTGAGTDDPGPERDRVQYEIERLENQLQEVTKTEVESRTRLVLAEDKLSNCAREVGDAERKTKAARNKSTPALQSAGFADSSAARAAFRDAGQLSELQTLLADYEREVGILKATITDVENELQGRKVSEEESNRAQVEYDECSRRKQAADKQIGLLNHRIDEMSKQLAIAENVRNELREQSYTEGVERSYCVLSQQCIR